MKHGVVIGKSGHNWRVLMNDGTTRLVPIEHPKDRQWGHIMGLPLVFYSFGLVYLVGFLLAWLSAP